MVSRSFALSAMFAGLLSVSIAHAEDPPALTEDLFLGEMPQVLGATRLRQPLSETPAAVTVIDRQMIEASGALAIPDLLRLVPGFQVGHDGGHWTTVTYHGFSDKYARRLQVLIDGRSVYTPAFGGVVWNDLPIAIEDVDHIEVIRGPNGVTYGANSFSAIVNIVTRSATQDSGLFLEQVAGGEETRRTLGRYVGGGDNLRVRFTAGYHRDDGINNPDIVDDQRTSLANFLAEYRVNARDSLSTYLGYAGGTRGEGETGDTQDPPRDRDMSSNYQQLRWHRLIDADQDLSVNLYHTYHKSFDTFTSRFMVTIPPFPPAPATSNVSQDVMSERFDVELQHTLRLREDLRLVWGAEARRDVVAGAGWFNTQSQLDSHLYRLFSNAEWRIAPDWIANLGAMYEHNDFTGGDVSPRLALNYHVTPEQTLRAGYSRAFRTPSFLEDQGDARPCATALGMTACFQLIKASTHLRPERIDAYEIGYLGSFFDRRLNIDLRLFREQIRDVIAWHDDAANVLTFSNDGYANITGWETQLEWRPTRQTRLIGSYSYGYQRGQVLTDAAPVTYGDTYRSTPTHTLSAMLIQRLPYDLDASVTYYRVSQMRWLDQGDDDDTHYDALDARLAYHLRVAGVRGTLALVGQNLGGSYFDYRNAMVLTRRYLLQFSVEAH